jgi:hypothetical protein
MHGNGTMTMPLDGCIIDGMLGVVRQDRSKRAAPIEATRGGTGEMVQTGRWVRSLSTNNPIDQYSTNIGSVSAEGTRRVSPKETITYVLISDGPFEHEPQETQLTVSECSRGDDEFPTDLNRFQNPVTINRAAGSLPKFLAMIHRILQDDMGFSIKEFQNSDEQFVFITKLSQRVYCPRHASAKLCTFGARLSVATHI